jgi:hypothetical protein
MREVVIVATAGILIGYSSGVSDEFGMSELLANPNRRIRPHAPVSVPYRLSLRPIASRRWSDIHRRRWRIIVTRVCDRGSDYGPCGEAAYNTGRDIAAACLRWRHRSTGAGKQRPCRHQDKWPFHFAPRSLEIIRGAA